MQGERVKKGFCLFILSPGTRRGSDTKKGRGGGKSKKKKEEKEPGVEVKIMEDERVGGPVS